jgi:hypothetical protein
MNINIVNITMYISIILQILAGFVGLDGFRYKIPEQDSLLQTILGLETGVQFIELLFYIMFVIVNIPVESMAGIRYYDWFFTTPTMLLSTMLFFYYKRSKEIGENGTLTSFFSKYKWPTIIILIANALMLILGYAGEMGWVSIMSAFVWGFIFFAVAFYEMWDYFVKEPHAYGRYNINGIENMENNLQEKSESDIEIEKPSVLVSYQNEILGLFIFLFVVWSIYGVVYPFNAELKNISFNLLDVISKNFYGLFIYWKILQLV